jgi:tRNA-2-methylthio-N6-dimethylallyladenosine synthase
MPKAFDFGVERLAGVGVGVPVGVGVGETREGGLKPPLQGRTQEAGQRPFEAQGKPALPGTQGTFFLETFGCQMNEHDSEKVAGVLLARGYTQVETTDAASIILYNTCSIREKAAQKVFSRLGEWRPNEKSIQAWEESQGSNGPSTSMSGHGSVGHEEPKNRSKDRPLQAPIIGVLGCVAQQEGEEIFARAPWVSLVCGSASYRKLPEMIAQLEAGNTRVTGLDTDTDETFETEMTRRDNPWRAYLTIIEGCDKTCSYCVVPFTRGPERSRASASILREVKELADLGYTEVQLLGQTVNSYADPSERKMRFSELLVAVAEVAGIRRVRFTTSHPRDFGKDIVEAMEAVPRICNHVHLPVQSGSSAVLRAMQRTYTREEYLEKIAMIRAAKRPISVTTDIIVGFPGETEKDFGETLGLLEEVKYDGAFTFKYSPRPNTPSLKMADAIPDEEKTRRLMSLMEKQREIQAGLNAVRVGKRYELLVVNKSRRENQWSGHTTDHKVVVFTSRRQELLGDYVLVEVKSSGENSLVGEEVEVAPIGSRGLVKIKP